MSEEKDYIRFPDGKADLLSLTPEELTSLFLSVGEPKYRAVQLFPQLHKGVGPDSFTSFSAATKGKILSAGTAFFPEVEQKLVSKIDGTVKFLFRLYDGNAVESVLMEYEHGHTLCISSQVGCRMGCRFCASTIGGKVRDLLPSELLGQIIGAQKETGVRVDNVVMMGIGEPLDNYDNVVRFLRLVSREGGLNIGLRHISLSTCGVVPGILRLAKEELPITLSVSLHAYDDETRSSVMPVNKKWNIAELTGALKTYYAATGRRISFEYTLIAGKNDSPAGAEKLADLLRSSFKPKAGEGMPLHVNLIPVNEVEETGYKQSDRDAVKKFAAVLEKRGIRATVRRTLGSDIAASCGQLRRKRELEKKEAEDGEKE